MVDLHVRTLCQGIRNAVARLEFGRLLMPVGFLEEGFPQPAPKEQRLVAKPNALMTHQTHLQ